MRPRLNIGNRRMPGILVGALLAIFSGDGWAQIQDNPPFVLRVREAVPGQPATVSVARLRHHIPRRALKEFNKSADAVEKGDSQAAIAHLKKALEIDPAFVEAHNNLGARYLVLQQYERALEEFQKALALDDRATLVYPNMAIAYLGLGRYADAERAARRGLWCDPTSNRCRLLLGLALEGQERDLPEALENLAAAAREFPTARLSAARILAREGDRPRAVKELRKYLSTGVKENRRKLESWLKNLTQ
jgi:tetratricopeptide (TPR) repeat protein